MVTETQTNAEEYLTARLNHGCTFSSYLALLMASLPLAPHIIPLVIERHTSCRLPSMLGQDAIWQHNNVARMWNNGARRNTNAIRAAASGLPANKTFHYGEHQTLVK